MQYAICCRAILTAVAVHLCLGADNTPIVQPTARSKQHQWQNRGNAQVSVDKGDNVVQEMNKTVTRTRSAKKSGKPLERQSRGKVPIKTIKLPEEKYSVPKSNADTTAVNIRHTRPEVNSAIWFRPTARRVEKSIDSVIIKEVTDEKDGGSKSSKKQTENRPVDNQATPSQVGRLLNTIDKGPNVSSIRPPVRNGSSRGLKTESIYRQLELWRAENGLSKAANISERDFEKKRNSIFRPVRPSFRIWKSELPPFSPRLFLSQSQPTPIPSTQAEWKTQAKMAESNIAISESERNGISGRTERNRPSHTAYNGRVALLEYGGETRVVDHSMIAPSHLRPFAVQLIPVQKVSFPNGESINGERSLSGVRKRFVMRRLRRASSDSDLVVSDKGNAGNLNYSTIDTTTGSYANATVSGNAVNTTIVTGSGVVNTDNKVEHFNTDNMAATNNIGEAGAIDTNDKGFILSSTDGNDIAKTKTSNVSAERGVNDTGTGSIGSASQNADDSVLKFPGIFTLSDGIASDVTTTKTTFPTTLTTSAPKTLSQSLSTTTLKPIPLPAIKNVPSEFWQDEVSTVVSSTHTSSLSSLFSDGPVDSFWPTEGTLASTWPAIVMTTDKKSQEDVTDGSTDYTVIGVTDMFSTLTAFVNDGMKSTVTKMTSDNAVTTVQQISTTASMSSLTSLDSTRVIIESRVPLTDLPNHISARSTDPSTSGPPTQPFTQTGPTSTTKFSLPEFTTIELSADSMVPVLPRFSDKQTTADDSSSIQLSSAFATSPGSTPDEPGRAVGKDDLDPEPSVDEDEAEAEPEAEPGPDWEKSKMIWQEAWGVHLYFFGGLFGGLGVYILFSVLRLWRIHRLLSRRYFLSLNLLMLLMCTTRAVYLLVDGYNSNGTFHPVLDYFLYSISFPCLTSAFGIQLYVLLQASKMHVLPPTVQKMSLLIAIVIVHFILSIVTDAVVGLYAGTKIMLFVCQMFFILWGIFLFVSYAYIFRRLYRHAIKRQENVTQYKQAAYNGDGKQPVSKSKFTLSLAVKVTFLTAVLGLVIVFLEVIAVVEVYKTFSDDLPGPWPWYGYHSALRMVEVLMCATIVYVASQPFRYRREQQSCGCYAMLCAPCAEICCCGADVNRSDTEDSWSQLDQLGTSLDSHQCTNGSLNYDNSRAVRDISLGDVKVKARIYFSDHDDVAPIVSSQPGSRPTSATSDTVESAPVNARDSANWNLFSPVISPSSPEMVSTPTKSWNGVVNTAYMPNTEHDDQRSRGRQSPSSLGFESRKASIASSEYFLAPSVSLAGSMASELDKAFRSMHEEIPCNMGDHSYDQLSIDKSLDGHKRAMSSESNVERFLQQQDSEEFAISALRRSRSAIGRCSFTEREPLRGDEREEEGGGEEKEKNSETWRHKLFRSRSDNLGGIRTKDVDSATYMSLLDIERRQLELPASDSRHTHRGNTHHQDSIHHQDNTHHQDSETSLQGALPRAGCRIKGRSTSESSSPAHRVQHDGSYSDGDSSADTVGDSGICRADSPADADNGRSPARDSRVIKGSADNGRSPARDSHVIKGPADNGRSSARDSHVIKGPADNGRSSARDSHVIKGPADNGRSSARDSHVIKGPADNGRSSARDSHVVKGSADNGRSPARDSHVVKGSADNGRSPARDSHVIKGLVDSVRSPARDSHVVKGSDDASGAVSSSKAPYCSVITLGGLPSAGNRNLVPTIPTASFSSNGIFLPPTGLLRYGYDDSDDIEV